MAAGSVLSACGSSTPAARPPVPPIPPLADGVFARRMARVRAILRDAPADVAFVSSGTTHFAYLAGGAIERSERLVALLVPRDAEPFVVAPSFEVERIRRTTRITRIVAWEENESPYEAAARELARVDAQARAVLVEPHVEYATAMALARAIAGATLVRDTGAFDRLRVVKEPEEIARIARAVEITLGAFDDAFASLREGMHDRDVSGRIAHTMKSMGAESGYALVQFGALSALPHAHPAGNALARESGVLIDGGCTVDGYVSDITRTRWFGSSPPDEIVRVHRLVHDAQSAAIARVATARAAQDIDRAARDVIARAGYGPYFTHRTGHGLGMDGHEPIYVVEGNVEPLVAGCVFTIEPGVYLPGRFGVRIEDDVLRGPDGSIVLSARAPREIAIVRA